MLNQYLILRLISHFIFPVIVIFALYIQLNGEVSPGGGFQAGAIFASAILSIRMIKTGSLKYMDDSKFLTVAAITGVLIYAITGIVCMLLGGNYLDYNSLSSNHITGQHIGIVVIELGVGITVAATMMLIHLIFSNHNAQL